MDQNKMIDAKTAFDKLATQYDQAFLRKVDLMENQVAFGLIPQEGRVLDLGYGTGLYLEYCHPDLYIGLDISPGMLEVARSKLQGSIEQWGFIEGDMADLGTLHDDSFDAVISTFGGFSYCLQPHRAIGEMHRVLKPGGTVFIMACGERHRHRSSHIVNDVVPYITWDRKTLKHAFWRFQQVKVTGISGYISALLPGAMALEMHTLGRLWPSSCYFQIVTGTK